MISTGSFEIVTTDKSVLFVTISGILLIMDLYISENLLLDKYL